MTTAAETIPTLREIEQGLRQRLADLTALREAEQEKRERAKEKVEQVAISAGNNNSIGESLDDLLVELGLHGRPRAVSQMISVEVRQTVPIPSVRDLYVGGNHVYGAYMNVTECTLYTTFDVGLSVMVPRDHEGCACDLTPTQEAFDNHLGRLPEGVEVVDTTTKWCGYNAYPFTRDSEEPNACRNYRAMREAEKAAAHDDPLVQQCTQGHQYTDPHRHIFYANGDVTYSVREDYTVDHPHVRVPGWYGTGVQVGQPIPGTPEPVVEERVQQCEIGGHPRTNLHLHWQDEDGNVTYTRDLNWIAGAGYTRLGVFCRDADRVGGVVE